MNGEIYTIGYTSFDQDEFIEVLNSHKINCVIDVRSVPIASEYYQAYSKNNLQPFLNANKIYYKNYSKEFGARQTNPLFYTNNQLDFNKFIKTSMFIDGVKNIKKGIELGYNLVLMCAEKDPINCHRTIMVAKGLKDYGLNIMHILANKTLQSQDDIENRLLDLYFPKRNQMSLFENQNTAQQIEQSYIFQNKKIGYTPEQERKISA